MQFKLEDQDNFNQLIEKEHVLKRLKVNDMEIVQNIRTFVGVPAVPFMQVSRVDLNLPNDYFVHIDVGGEGYNEHMGYFSGFNTSINLNQMNYQSNQHNIPIPNLVKINRWGSHTTYPFADQFADYITMQNAPLTPKNIEEITRCLRPGGIVDLWIDDCSKDGIELLAKNLNSKAEYKCADEFNGSTGSNKVRIVSGIKPVSQEKVCPTSEHVVRSANSVLLLNSMFYPGKQKLTTQPEVNSQNSERMNLLGA